MSWKEHIAAGGTTVQAYQAYAQERIDSMTKVCLAETSTEMEIRVAQRVVAEMKRLRDLPLTLRAEAEQRT